MNFRNITLLILLTCSISTWAATTQVYQSLMPAAGQHELTPMAGIAAGLVGYKSAGDSAKTKLNQFMLGYKYGIAVDQSIGLQTGYSSAEYTTTTNYTSTTTDKYKGLNSFLINYQSLYEVTSFTAFTKVGYSFGLEKSKKDTDKNESNMVEPQNRLIFEAGAHQSLNEDIVLGGLVNYEKHLDGEAVSTSLTGDTTYKYSGGDIFYVAGFFEMPNFKTHPNVSLGLRRSYTLRSTNPSGSFVETPGLDFLILKASGRFEMNPNFSINPEIISQTLVGSSDIFDSYGLMGLSVTARLLF